MDEEERRGPPAGDRSPERTPARSGEPAGHGYRSPGRGAREDGPWILYGAYGFTGSLLAREAVRRGHAPILAGRDRTRLEPLAAELGLDARVVGLHDREALLELLASGPLVLHAAGPFVHTAPPVLEACLRTGTHYLDVTAEVPVFQRIFALDDIARAQGVLLLPGVGFGVAATDCLAHRLREALPDAVRLELAFAGGGEASAGTARTMLEHFPAGGLVRRGNRLVPLPLGRGARRVRFHDRERTVVPVPWGDLVTAHRSTGIPDITTFTVPPVRPGVLRIVQRPLRLLLGIGPVRRRIQDVAARRRSGMPARPADARARVWGRAENARGESRELRLETLEGYRFTAAAGIQAVEEVLAGAGDAPESTLPLRGALTPSLAFGSSFVDRIPGTRWWGVGAMGRS